MLDRFILQTYGTRRCKLEDKINLFFINTFSLKILPSYGKTLTAIKLAFARLIFMIFNP